MEEAREYVEETWATLERRLWLPEHGLYAEEADENWRVDPYRSESGNLHMTEVGGLFESFADKDLIPYQDDIILN